MRARPRVPSPTCAIMSPASAGPPMSAAWNTERLSDSAPGRSAGGTRRGMSAWRDGPSKATAEAERALRA